MAAKRVPQDPAALERLLDAQRLLCLGRQRGVAGGLDANVQLSHPPLTSTLLFYSPKLSLACAASVRGQIGGLQLCQDCHHALSLLLELAKPVEEGCTSRASQ